jgi:hypothetical protein
LNLPESSHQSASSSSSTRPTPALASAQSHWYKKEGKEKQKEMKKGRKEGMKSGWLAAKARRVLIDKSKNE